MQHNTYLASKPRYEILDGLRGVAAMVVILFHCLETYIPVFGTQHITKENASGSPFGLRGGFWWASLLLVAILAMPQIGDKAGIADGLYQTLAIVCA